MSSILKVDQLQDSGGNNLVTSNGSGVITAAGFGKVGQVVQVLNSTDTSANTTTYADTNLSASITPSSTSSKILINVTHDLVISASSSAAYGGIRILRGSTEIFDPNPANATGPFGLGIVAGSVGNIQSYVKSPLQFLDSPNTTSSVTYKTQARSYSTVGSMVLRFNQAATNNNGESIITLMEILP